MLIYVPLNQIEDNPFQARQEYGDVADLAARIAAARASYPDSYGLMQIPRGRVIVRNAAQPDGKILGVAKALTMTDKNRALLPDPAVRVQLAFGHRRLRAFRHLWETQEPGYERGLFPVQVGEFSDEQMLDAVWSENRERKDISAVEEAELLARKLERVKSQREVAEAYGLDRSTVANRLRLLELPADIQQANRDGRLSERACLALAPVVKLVEIGRTWSAGYAAPMPAAQYITELLSSPNGTTSDDIRKYAERAMNHAGKTLHRFVAEFETGEGGAIRQSKCRGCRFRSNNTCLDVACLQAKEAVIIECALEEAADELEVEISDRAEDFDTYTHNYRARKELRALWESGVREGTNFVIRWQGNSGMRPFSENEYLHDGDRFGNEGRAGIVLGHRGRLPTELLSPGGNKPVEDIASATDIADWDKEAKKFGQQAVKLAKRALVDALYLPAGDAGDIIQALMCDPGKEWIDDYEQLLKQFVDFMWDKGRGFQSYYEGWREVQLVRRVLERAGLNATAILSIDDWRESLRREAILALSFWYNRRGWGQHDWPDCQKALAAALDNFPEFSGIPGDENAKLLDLRYELRRAQRDLEAKQAAAKAAEEAVKARHEAAATNLAGEEDTDLYGDDLDLDDPDAEIGQEMASPDIVGFLDDEPKSVVTVAALANCNVRIAAELLTEAVLAGDAREVYSGAYALPEKVAA